MDVQILATKTIKPSVSTPPHFKNYKLSLLDQFVPSIYVPFIFFYPNNKFVSDKNEILTQLKESLSQVLTIYYPLAGRLKDCTSIDCNDEGVEFIEAEAIGISMYEFLKKPDIGALNSFLPCNANILEKGSSDIPLAKIKTTVFHECGGIVIGFCMFHRIGDGGTAAGFLNNWAKISRGWNEKVDHPNFTFGSITFPASETLTTDFVMNVNNFFFADSKSLVRRYVFDPTTIKALKNKAVSKKVPNPTRVEVLTAFVVKHMMNGIAKSEDELTITTLMINHAVNLRWRIETPLKLANDNIFGNIIWFTSAFHESHNIDNDKSISKLVETVNEAFISLNKESISELGAGDGAIFTSLSEFMGSICSNNKIKFYNFTSWCNMGFYNVNFGWGNPVWVALMGNPIDGFRSMQGILIIESSDISKGGVELWLVANEQEISVLEKDMEFLTYATPNPGISLFVE